MNFVFSPLEKNRVPYGLLKDFAMEFTDLERYNGSVNDSNYVDQGDFFDIYQTLFTSRIHSNAGTWVNPIVADSLWYLQRDVNLITIGGLCYGYSSFRENAYSSSLLTISNDQIHDRYVNGVWQNPYQTALSIAFAPVVNEHKGRNISVLIPSVAWFTNQQISSIQLDAGNGSGYQTIIVGQAAPVFYPDSGLKTMNFKVTLANNQVLYSHSQIHIANAVNPADDAPAGQYRTSSLAANGPQAIESDETYEGKKAYGYMTIRYADPNDPVLRRPLIIAEGYDPGNILAPEKKYGNSDADAFLPENLPNGSILRNLISQYDLVYIDWKNGTDNLYRNAKLLKKIIALVNANKVAVNGVIQPNVIIGQSMGGVITHIALKEMENAGIDHQTRLFISQDAPQQGANVPIAYQYMGRHFRNIYISTGTVALGVELFQLIRGGVSPLKALSLSNEPASQQMLINYISDFGSLRNIHHDDFYASLRVLGYPSQCRMVAMSNGSECANSQGFEPGASLLSIDGRVQTRFLGDVAVSALSYFVSPLFPLNRIFKIGFLPGKNEIRADINLHAIGNGGGNQVYYCDITYTKKLFYLVNINLTLAHKEKNADSGMIPIDGYPGGSLFPTEGLQSASLTNWFIKYNLNVSVNSAFNFVPTVSSLDIGGGSTALGSPDFLRVYSALSPPVAPKQTPFANFIVARQNNASVNEGHISFNARNADWIGNEIGTVAAGPNPQIIDCSYLCNANLIQGLSQICNSPQIYNIPNLPTGAMVTWSISPTNGVVSMSLSGNSVTLTRTGSGPVALTANVNTACGIVATAKNIEVIYPVSTSIGNYGQPYASSSWAEYFTYDGVVPTGNPEMTGKYFEIETTDGTMIQPVRASDYNVSPTQINGIGLRIDNFNHSVYGRVRYVNQCGTSDWKSFYIPYSGYYAYLVYPNPSNSTLTIAHNDSKAQGKSIDNDNDKGLPFDVKLFNEKGTMLSQGRSKNGKEISLNTQSIPNGTYFLHIIQGKETTKQQIIVNH